MEGGKKQVRFPLRQTESRWDYTQEQHRAEVNSLFTAREIIDILGCEKLSDGNRRVFEKALIKFITNKQIEEDKDDEQRLDLDDDILAKASELFS